MKCKIKFIPRDFTGGYGMVFDCALARSIKRIVRKNLKKRVHIGGFHYSIGEYTRNIPSQLGDLLSENWDETKDQIMAKTWTITLPKDCVVAS